MTRQRKDDVTFQHILSKLAGSSATPEDMGVCVVLPYPKLTIDPAASGDTSGTISVLDTDNNELLFSKRNVTKSDESDVPLAKGTHYPNVPRILSDTQKGKRRRSLFISHIPVRALQQRLNPAAELELCFMPDSTASFAQGTMYEGRIYIGLAGKGLPGDKLTYSLITSDGKILNNIETNISSPKEPKSFTIEWLKSQRSAILAVMSEKGHTPISSEESLDILLRWFFYKVLGVDLDKIGKITAHTTPGRGDTGVSVEFFADENAVMECIYEIIDKGNLNCFFGRTGVFVKPPNIELIPGYLEGATAYTESQVEDRARWSRGLPPKDRECDKFGLAVFNLLRNRAGEVVGYTPDEAKAVYNRLVSMGAILPTEKVRELFRSLDREKVQQVAQAAPPQPLIANNRNAFLGLPRFPLQPPQQPIPTGTYLLVPYSPKQW